MSIADLKTCWDDTRVAAAVRRVVGAALYAPDAPKLPAPKETRELVATLRDWLQQLEPAIEITREALQPAELTMIGVLNNFIHDFQAIDLHNGVFATTPKEVHQVKATLGKVYDLLGAILPYLAHDKAEAA